MFSWLRNVRRCLPAGRAASPPSGWARASLDEGIKILVRVDAQIENTQRPAGILFVQKGNQDVQIDPLIMFVPVEILEGHLTRSQDFRNALRTTEDIGGAPAGDDRRVTPWASNRRTRSY